MEEKYIKEIINESMRAYKKGEIPVGCIIVNNKKIIAKSHNIVEKKQSVIYHAEIVALKKAAQKLKNWRLNGCEMYVTLQPCPMCAYAIKMSRIKKVYYLLPQNEKEISNCEMIYLEEYSKKYKKILQGFFKSIRK